MAQLSATEWAERTLSAMTFADLRRMERSWATLPGYLDEHAFWFLVRRMLDRLAREDA